jgi:hypothetical protein
MLRGGADATCRSLRVFTNVVLGAASIIPVKQDNSDVMLVAYSKKHMHLNIDSPSALQLGGAFAQHCGQNWTGMPGQSVHLN